LVAILRIDLEVNMIVIAILLLVGGLAQGPLLAQFFAALWSSPNHFFFPLGLLAIAGLAYVHRATWLDNVIDEIRETVHFERRRGNRFGFGVGLCASFVFFFVAHALHWPHVGWLALILLGMSIAYREFGLPGLRSAVPLAILLWFLKPVPDFAEPWLQLWLQGLASRFAGVVLDFMRVFYYSQGVVLGLVSQGEVASDVCNGVRSLYVAIFVAIAWGVYFKYHWFRTALNVTQVLFWVIVWNGLRIALLLGNQDAGGDWHETPWMVAILEFLCLSAILFLAWSGDQFLASVVEPKKQELPMIIQPVQDHTGYESAWSSRTEYLGWSIAFGLLALLGWRMSTLHTREHGAQRMGGVSELPSELAGWKITAAENPELPRLVPIFMPGYSDSAKSWDIEKEGRKLQFSILGSSTLYPGPRWHWTWFGWTASVRSKELTVESENESSHARMLELSRLPGEAGGAIASGVDGHGLALRSGEPLGTSDRLTSSLRLAVYYAIGGITRDEARATLLSRPIYSVALYQKSAKPLPPEAWEKLGDLYPRLLPTLFHQDPLLSETSSLNKPADPE
jgi:hypothetical protein